MHRRRECSAITLVGTANLHCAVSQPLLRWQAPLAVLPGSGPLGHTHAGPAPCQQSLFVPNAADKQTSPGLATGTQCRPASVRLATNWASCSGGQATGSRVKGRASSTAQGVGREELSTARGKGGQPAGQVTGSGAPGMFGCSCDTGRGDARHKQAHTRPARSCQSTTPCTTCTGSQELVSSGLLRRSAVTAAKLHRSAT